MSTLAGHVRAAPRFRLHLHLPRLPRLRRRDVCVAITPYVDVYPPG